MIQIGSENSKDLETTLHLNNVRASREFESSLPTPGFLLSYLTSEQLDEGPKVILPDGGVIRKPYDPASGWQFSDEVARIWAAENNGIFFSSKFGTEGVYFSFRDFLESLSRCMKNIPRPTSGSSESHDVKLYVAAQKPEALEELSKEAKYLRDVTVPGHRDASRAWIISQALEGFVHSGDGSSDDTYFGLAGSRSGDSHRYQIKLGLALRGFGYRHFNVSARRLSCDIDVLSSEGIEKDSLVAEIIKDYASKVNAEFYNSAETDASSLGFEANLKTYINGNRVNKIGLSLSSPRTRFWSNDSLVYHVAPTDKMLPVFRGISDKIALALIKYEEHMKARHDTEYKACAIITGLDIKAQP